MDTLSQLTAAQLDKIQWLAANNRATSVLITVGSFDLPSDYILCHINFGQSHPVVYGIDAEGLASS